MTKLSSKNFFAPLALEQGPDEQSLYPYDELPEGSDVIRLLHLESAQHWSYPLKGTLATVSLAKAPAYKALSYVWGLEFEEYDNDDLNGDSGGDSDTENESNSDYDSGHPRKELPCEITLAGHTIKIGRHLYNALKRIRGKKRGLLAWADAICIDQLNIYERNHQVKLMTEIYSTADEVYVCFDDDEMVNKYFQTVCPSINRCAEYWRRWSSTPVTLREPLEEPEFDMLVADLIDTDWWNRAWTAQEFLLGRKIKLFFFSDESLTTNDLMDWVDYLADYDRMEAIGYIRDKEGEHHTDRSKRPVGRYIHSHFSDELGWAIHIKPLFRLRQRLQNEPHLVNTLDLVAFSRYRQASEVRDKIFAFLGLSPKMLDLVDYNLPVESCFEQFAVHSIQLSKTLDIFNHIIVLTSEYISRCTTHRYLASQERTDFPSWVPDWTVQLAPEDFTALRMRVQQLSCQPKAARPISSRISTSRPYIQYLGSGKLAVRGRVYSTISKVGIPYLSRYGPSAQSHAKGCIGDWIQLATEHGGSKPSRGPLDQRAQRIKLHRALTRGLSYQWIQHLNDDSSTPPNTNRFTSLDHQLMRLFVRHFTYAEPDYTHLYAQPGDILGDGTDHLLAHLDMFADFILDNAVLERFVVDVAGRFGFVPATARAGDMLVQFEGSSTLYVLSRCRQGRENRGKSMSKKAPAGVRETYRLLGPAYLGDDDADDPVADLAGFMSLGLEGRNGSAVDGHEVKDTAQWAQAKEFVLV